MTLKLEVTTITRPDDGFTHMVQVPTVNLQRALAAEDPFNILRSTLLAHDGADMDWDQDPRNATFLFTTRALADNFVTDFPQYLAANALDIEVRRLDAFRRKRRLLQARQDASTLGGALRALLQDPVDRNAMDRVTSLIEEALEPLAWVET